MPTGEVEDVHIQGKGKQGWLKGEDKPKATYHQPHPLLYEFDDGNQIMKRKEEIKLKSAYYRTFNPLLYL